MFGASPAMAPYLPGQNAGASYPGSPGPRLELCIMTDGAGEWHLAIVRGGRFTAEPVTLAHFGLATPKAAAMALLSYAEVAQGHASFTLSYQTSAQAAVDEWFRNTCTLQPTLAGQIAALQAGIARNVAAQATMGTFWNLGTDYAGDVQPRTCIAGHAWVDTGMLRTWCKHCPARATFDRTTARWAEDKT